LYNTTTGYGGSGSELYFMSKLNDKKWKVCSFSGRYFYICNATKINLQDVKDAVFCAGKFKNRKSFKKET